MTEICQKKLIIQVKSATISKRAKTKTYKLQIKINKTAAKRQSENIVSNSKNKKRLFHVKIKKKLA